MDNTGNGYSSRGNAKKAAEAKINKGTSPAVDYGIKPGDDGRFYIAWQTAATTDEFAKTPEAQANQASWENMLDKALAAGWPDSDNPDGDRADSEPAATADTGADTRDSAGAANEPAEPDSAPTAAPAVPASAVSAEGSEADPFPAGSEVQLRARMVGQVSRRVDEHTWEVTVILGAAQLLRPGQRAARAARKPAGEPRRPRGKNAEMDEAAARGVMPTKPDVTSHANHHYQKRFDKLAELAAAADWDAVAGYECNGVNSYAKMVRQYRDRLVTAHNAQQATAAQGAAQ